MVPTDELEGYRSHNRLSRMIVAAVAIALVGAIVYAVLRTAEQAAAPGSPAPRFTLSVLGGESVLSSEDLEGSPVVLNFWASWCGPCNIEAPLLEETWRAYRDDGVQFVGVNINDTESAARAFVKKYGITYPIVVDSKDELARSLDVGTGLPQTFFIDDNWEIASIAAGNRVGGQAGAVYLGAISEDELTAQIDQLLDDAGDGS